jgi:hypothetical protein
MLDVHETVAYKQFRSRSENPPFIRVCVLYARVDLVSVGLDLAVSFLVPVLFMYRIQEIPRIPCT